MPDRELAVAIPPRLELDPNEGLTLWFDLDGDRVTVRLETYDYGRIRENVRKVEDQKRKRSD